MAWLLDGLELFGVWPEEHQSGNRRFENLYSPEIHPVANNAREHREKLN